jgi:glycosyltransferase involved in cell wall biosynthesis
MTPEVDMNAQTNQQHRDPQTVSVDVVIPVYNEEAVLATSINTLREYLIAKCPYRWRIVIANNASKDRTLEVAQGLAAQYPGEVDVLHLDQKGRGRALKLAWSGSTADVMSYMDVDLSTNLDHFMTLITPVVEGRYHVATGSRLMPGARVKRQPKREIISRCYNLIVKIMFPTRKFFDAQCGFKAIDAAVRTELIPHIVDNAWFFDTELLIRSEQQGWRVWEIPVEWIEDLDTRVKIIDTAIEDLKGLARVRVTPLKRR